MYATRKGRAPIATALELTAADIGEIHARWTSGRALVEIDGNPELSSHSLSKAPGDRDTLVHGRILERNKRNDVGGANSRMLS